MLALVLWSACEQKQPPEFSFYDDRIAPVVEVGCVAQTTGCHIARADQTAVGNLDLSSYDSLLRREDVLLPTGPYPVGQLLLKAGDAVEIPVQTFDSPDPNNKNQRFVAIKTDIRHAAGALLREGSDGYAAVKSWAQQGYRRGGKVEESVSINIGACRPGVGKHRGFDPDAAPADAKSFARFLREVQPLLLERCAGSSCHGTPIADLHLSCGKSDAETRWNYFVSVAHVDSSVSLSELLRRPLSSSRGGTYHEGGNVFPDTEDPAYKTLRAWIEDLVDRAPKAVDYQPEDEGLRFFGNYVEPVLVKKGCMFQNCHSVAMFHDLRLRGGSQGSFSRIAIDKNYEMTSLMLSLESADPNDSRLIAKNLFPPARNGKGLAHRGGALFEDFGENAKPSDCDGIDVTTMPINEVPAYCVMVQWHKLERDLALARGELAPGPSYGLLWVSRPLGVGDVRDFDTYRPGADLLRGEVTLDASGRPAVSAGASLTVGCGLKVASADIRGPAVSWDAKTISFAARDSETAPLRIYTANADGSKCAPLAEIQTDKPSDNGILIHDFDPAFAPDGRLVFASTRGNLNSKGYDYSGPTRTRSTLAPNANLYIYARKAETLRQLTFLNNQELMPSFMSDGRVIFTAEKREPEFFQLAGRRQNLDGGDYHPLFAQRDSVGFEMATELVELPNRDFALVAAPFGAKDGAGAIAIINRSVGPDQDDRDPRDPFYLSSLSIPAASALDRGRGAFRSPSSLPSRFMIVSCDQDATDLKRGDFDFDLCSLDPSTGDVTLLAGEAGRAEVEAVAIYARTNHGVFESRIDEANGTTRVVASATDAQVHYSDFPMLATLLFENTRTGRPIDDDIRGFDVLESFPPPASAQRFADLDAKKVIEDDFGSVFVDYRELGAVGLFADGSAAIRIPGGHPVLLRLTDDRGEALEFGAGDRFTGAQIQREESQFYPGERVSQGFPRRLFNGMCGGCHGSITGYELDVAVDVDVLTSASRDTARGEPPVELGR